jgi:hypothetical protein
MDYAGILTTTAQSLAGYVVDGIHNGSVLPARFLTKPVDWDEGQYMQQPIQTVENDNGGDFVGMPVFDVSAQNTDQNLNGQLRVKGNQLSYLGLKSLITRLKLELLSSSVVRWMLPRTL